MDQTEAAILRALVARIDERNNPIDQGISTDDPCLQEARNLAAQKTTPEILAENREARLRAVLAENREARLRAVRNKFALAEQATLEPGWYWIRRCEPDGPPYWEIAHFVRWREQEGHWLLAGSPRRLLPTRNPDASNAWQIGPRVNPPLC